MIPKQENVQVFSNSQNEKTFTINASREAFRILSSGLYSNKPQAIIRELSCNAYDAHVMAGHPDKPFLVHLPCAWEPYLSIEDFGIGLDDDDVNNIYTSYFTSTKTHSNDVIGGLGLGSKTPFSYTDSFTIRARKDSVERLYSAYISDAGSPTVSLISEADTEEPNGVMITLPIRKDDFRTFAREAEKVFAYFKVLPIISSGEALNLDNSLVTRLDENHGLIVNSNSYNSCNVTCVMGNVGYNFRVTDTLLDLKYDRAWKFLNKTSLTIRFNIGDLSVAANRETISFDDESKEVFVNRIVQIMDDYYKDFQDHIDNNLTTAHEALTYVENELGEWGWGILNFEGNNLYDISNENIMESIIAIIDPDDSHRSITMLEKKYRGSDNLGKSTINDKYGISRLTNKGFRSKKISFIMDDTDHHRGFDVNSRSWIRHSNTYFDYLVQLPFVLSEDQQDKLDELLGANLHMIRTLSDVKEEFKVIREKKKVESGPRKDPVDRAKKNEIRLDCWINNDEAPTIGYMGQEYLPHKNKLLDIDELSTKRVGLLHVYRGQIMGDVYSIGYESSFEPPVLIHLTKLFDLDVIILAKSAQLEKVRERLPFVIEVSSLEGKDVKNNEAFMLTEVMNRLSNGGFIAGGLSGLNSFLEDSNSPTKLQNSMFVNHYSSYEQRRDPNVKIASVFKQFNIPDLNNNQLCIDLVDKLSWAAQAYTEHEVTAFNQHIRLPIDTPVNGMFNKFAELVATEVYEKNKAIVDKYPLISHLEFENYEDGYDKFVNDVNEYIELINNSK